MEKQKPVPISKLEEDLEIGAAMGDRVILRSVYLAAYAYFWFWGDAYSSEYNRYGKVLRDANATLLAIDEFHKVILELTNEETAKAISDQLRKDKIR